MAGEPASLAAVQGAILKSSAARQAHNSPSENLQANAVAQDLAVMADQAQGYSAGVAAGDVEAAAQAASQASRLDQERAQADAERARSLELARTQTAAAAAGAEEGRLRAQAQAADNTKAVEAAAQAAEAERVIFNAAAHLSSLDVGAIQDALSASTNPQEAMAVFVNRKDQGTYVGETSDGDIQKAIYDYYDALNGRTTAAAVIARRQRERHD